MFNTLRFPLAILSLVVFAGATAAQQSPRPHIVMLIAESEYNTEQTLPQFAEQMLADYRVTIVSADPDDPNTLQSIEAIDQADLLLISVRRRTLPTDQLQRVRRFVAAGKPVVGIRTASHAFSLRNKQPEQGRAVWPQFDAQVFGGNYTNHHGNSLKVTVRVAEAAAQGDPVILDGLESIKPFTSGGSLYKVSPLADAAEVYLTGSVEGHPAEPVAWTFRRDDGGKSFYTSLGHVADFQGDVLPRLLANAVRWGLQSDQ